MLGKEPTSQQTLALVFGASTFPRLPGLAQGRSFYNSSQDFCEYLTDPHGLALPGENVCSLFDDSQSSGDQLRELREFLNRRTDDLSRAGTPAQDLIIYYVGHGLFAESDSHYCFAIRSTIAGSMGQTSIRSGDLAYTVKGNARFLRSFLILDCCFSAKATREFQSAPLTVSRVKLLQEFPARGTTLLCSASAENASIAPQGHTRTLFSDNLLKALRDGHPMLGARLSISELGDLVKLNIPAQYKPQMHSPDQREGDVADVPLFPNPAWVAQNAGETRQPGLSAARNAGPTVLPADVPSEMPADRWRESKERYPATQNAPAVENSTEETSGEVSIPPAGDRECLAPTTLDGLMVGGSYVQIAHPFHAEASSIVGVLEQPIKVDIRPQTYVQLPAEGGFLSQVSKGYNVEGLVSFRSASSQVSGQSTRDSRIVLASAIVEGLNLFEVITADRVVCRLSVEFHFEGGSASIQLLGTRFENLRIGGYPAEVILDPELSPRILKRRGEERARAADNPAWASAPLSVVNEIRGNYPARTFWHIVDLRDIGQFGLAEVLTFDDTLSLTMLRFASPRTGSLRVGNCVVRLPEGTLDEIWNRD